MANVILEEVKVYTVVNFNGRVMSDCVYLNKDKAQNICEHLLWEGRDVCVDSFALPFAGKHASYVHIYRGFDYGRTEMYDVVIESELFASVELAKQLPAWQRVEQRAKANPDQFNVYENKICSRDTFGDDWYYGDVMEDNVQAEIRKLKIVR